MKVIVRHRVINLLLFAGAMTGLFFATSVQAASISERMTGRILLDVERNGEAWYVNPIDRRRHYLGRPNDAIEVMRELGLGISNVDLARFESDASLRKRLAGRILLQVEEYGEGYYVDPVDLTKHYLGTPEMAFNLMRAKGLGITSGNLATISIAISDGISVSQAVHHVVPFTAQAPFGEWDDPRQQEGCEEASVIMAVAWATDGWITPERAHAQILEMSDWEKSQWGYFHDTSAKDTVERLFKDFFDYRNVELEYHVTSQDLIDELNEGNIVLVPVDGTTVGNPYFVQPGPLRHMMVITGFDPLTQEFIANDPGTRKGQNLRFTRENIERSLKDYNSGEYAPLGNRPSAMIIVKKS